MYKKSGKRTKILQSKKAGGGQSKFLAKYGVIQFYKILSINTKMFTVVLGCCEIKI